MKIITPGREYETDDGQRIRFLGGGNATGTTTEELAEILADRHQTLVMEGQGWPRWHDLISCFRGVAFLLNKRREFLEWQKAQPAQEGAADAKRSQA